MSKVNAIEFLKNIKWHCEHEEMEADFIIATIEFALKELGTNKNVYSLRVAKGIQKRKDK